MWSPFRLSETARAVLWLWQNDRDNWRVGTHEVVHQQVGVGVWTANERYGLHLNFNIPSGDRPHAHSCNGREIRLGSADRRALYRTITLGLRAEANSLLQRQISDWGADHIPNPVGERATAPH